jgi:hypothetical protein
VIDDRSRVSFAEFHPDERGEIAVAHLRSALAYYRALGVKVRRVLTDSGTCY